MVSPSCKHHLRHAPTPERPSAAVTHRHNTSDCTEIATYFHTTWFHADDSFSHRSLKQPCPDRAAHYRSHTWPLGFRRTVSAAARRLKNKQEPLPNGWTPPATPTLFYIQNRISKQVKKKVRSFMTKESRPVVYLFLPVYSHSRSVLAALVAVAHVFTDYSRGEIKFIFKVLEYGLCRSHR